ncbi:MAG: HNH endonuclease [Tildeniella nuda ZEHNDER 1965/U140]|nr:HNH endonuclease [Tildeniella nuda ZEHNDER 1965/U140]
MSSYIPVELRNQIGVSDRNQCCYCLTQAVNSGIDLSFDHILPRSKGGETTFDNVCLACRACNEFKSDLTEFADPLTEAVVLLFNPRRQKWTDHFVWSEDGIRMEGLTTIGRATVVALQMNRATIRVARKRWVSGGWHPPKG